LRRSDRERVRRHVHSRMAILPLPSLACRRRGSCRRAEVRWL